MKCPKCGYTSFDYLDNCKKCGVDLSAVRGMLGVIAVAPDEMAVASPRGASAAAPEMMAQTPVDDFTDINFGIQPTSMQSTMEEEDEEISLDSFVEHTAYNAEGEKPQAAPVAARPQPQEPPPAAPAQAKAKPEDDEFLDLDFGGIFEEEEKK